MDVPIFSDALHGLPIVNLILTWDLVLRSETLNMSIPDTARRVKPIRGSGETTEPSVITDACRPRREQRAVCAYNKGLLWSTLISRWRSHDFPRRQDGHVKRSNAEHPLSIPETVTVTARPVLTSEQYLTPTVGLVLFIYVPDVMSESGVSDCVSGTTRWAGNGRAPHHKINIPAALNKKGIPMADPIRPLPLSSISQRTLSTTLRLNAFQTSGGSEGSSCCHRLGWHQ